MKEYCDFADKNDIKIIIYLKEKIFLTKNTATIK
jgi:hypothetical protein